jgi:cell fate regulator YaaT (PSP1 superfamily)
VTLSHSYIARHGVMRRLGVFATPTLGSLRRATPVILRTPRGTEWGEVLCEAHPDAVKALNEPSRGDLLRVATAADEQAWQQVQDKRADDFGRADSLIQQHRLAMQLVDTERVLGEEYLVCYYLAENRVDFRALVKAMAREFRLRIELRQIGVREEAKLLADYGDCGQPVCCQTHLSTLPPVNMRMAKVQKASLDPNKVAGRCGRLKCCLRYEQDVYDEKQAVLPDVGSKIATKTGVGRVLVQEVLAQRLLVEFEDGRRLSIALADVLTRL